MNRDKYVNYSNHIGAIIVWAVSTLASAAMTLTLLGTARAAQNADAKVVPCGSSITACGCTITKSGYYEIDAALDNTQGLTAYGDCLDIRASNVLLNGATESITGAGTGVGLRVLKSAKNARIAGNEIVVSGWNIGMEIDSTNTITDWVETSSNATAGIFLNGAHNANVTDFTSKSNTIFGLWIRGGANNSINCSGTRDNGQIGLYVGCHDDGSFGTKCKGVGASKNNHLFDHNSAGNGNAGIVIDVGNTNNVIADWNGASNVGTYDSIDENTGCDGNQWLPGPAYTDYGNTNQSCIP